MPSNRSRSKTLALSGCIAVVAALLLLPITPLSAGVLQLTATAVRPTLTPASGSVTPAPPAESVAENPALAGYVWVNGDVFVPAAGAPVRFAGDGFELAALTDANGYYQFERVGQDVGLLNVAGDGTPWKASIKAVALSVQPGASLRVNFSASQGSPAAGPKLISVSVKPTSIGAGQTLTVTIKATNTTDQKLSGVWLTHLLPDALTIAGMSTDRGDTASQGPLALANLGDLAPGDVATFTIIANAPHDGGPQGNLSVIASLISREGVAVQTSTPLKGTGGPAMLPVTGMGEWLMLMGVALSMLLVGTHQLRRRRSRAGAA
ncbi:MAG TPA: hypothetical protein VJG32_11280 [Anaerolineae bacterium]|nr:hypothetical protein [Anaerolineae bacterium]